MAILESDVVFGIVLYKEELGDSVTFKTLVSSLPSVGKSTILVFDNTPRMNDKKKDNTNYFFNEFVEVFCETQNENKGLPFAYNFFANKAAELGKKWFVLLDQDTALPQDFYSKYLLINPKVKVHCPVVFSNGSLMSPAYYINFRSYPMQIPEKDSIDLKEYSCINSGLMINVDFFHKIGGYNKSLFLDFCDHDFIYKVKKNKIDQLGIIKCNLVQDFSSTNHTKEQAIQRYVLFLNDLRAFKKGKNKFQIFLRVDLPRLLKLTYQYKTLEFFKIRIT